MKIFADSKTDTSPFISCPALGPFAAAVGAAVCCRRVVSPVQSHWSPVAYCKKEGKEEATKGGGVDRQVSA